MAAHRPDPGRIPRRLPTLRRLTTHRTPPSLDARLARLKPRGTLQARRLPLLARLVFAAAVIALGALTVVAAGEALGRFGASLAASVGTAVAHVPPAATPLSTLPPLLDSPVLFSSTPYTNQPTVDLSGTLATEVAGHPEYRIRIYQRLRTTAAAPALVREQQVGATPEFIVAGVTLQKGIDFFSAALIGPGGETRPSAPVRVVYYATAPVIIVTSPRDGQTVDAPAVQLAGRVRAGALIVARNEATAASVTGRAGPDDAFSLTIGVAPGANGITLTATDLAGNAGTLVISVYGATGRQTASLTSSASQLSASSLPQPLTFTLSVTDPGGHPVVGVRVTFTLDVPPAAPVSADGMTDGAGTAIFSTTIPNGTAPGTILATALVMGKSPGSITARAFVVITK